MPEPTPADFEAHLRAAPDDVAKWGAYADFLTDRGDPPREGTPLRPLPGVDGPRSVVVVTGSPHEPGDFAFLSDADIE